MTTHAESIYSDLQRGLDRRFTTHTTLIHRIQNQYMQLKYQRATNTTATLVVTVLISFDDRLHIIIEFISQIYMHNKFSRSTTHYDRIHFTDIYA